MTNQSLFDAAYQSISDYTESLLPYPHPSGTPSEITAQQIANRDCEALAKFWASDEGQDWKIVIDRRIREEMRQRWGDGGEMEGDRW